MLFLLCRLEVQEDATVEKFKDFFKSSLEWSLALIGAKDFLRNEQAIFITISIALMMLFGINWRTTRSDHKMTLIYFVLLILGYLIVGITINSVVPNVYNKWVIYSMFLATVTTLPDHQRIFQEMKEIFKSICKATSLRLSKIIENIFRTNVGTQPAGGDGGGVGEDNV